jgi:electron transfer flavoprotein alpha subunit
MNNLEPDEPIFELANYGLEADLFKAVPELTAKIRKLKGL